MKRHEALKPLSRAHHKFLVVAQLLKVDAPNYPDLPHDVPGKIAYALNVYETEMKAHIALEEDHIFPLISGQSSEIDQLIYLLKDDHTELENRFDRLKGEVSQEYALDTLGYFLEQHIRIEERELFEMIQTHCSNAVLAQIQDMTQIENKE